MAGVRAFTRTWTAAAALLGESYLDSSLTVAEARVVYELARSGPAPLVELRRRIGLDAGYATRLLGRLSVGGLVERRTDPGDARRQILTLTPAGLGSARDLDARAAAGVSDLLDALPGDGRDRLTGALATARAVLETTLTPAPRADPEGGGPSSATVRPVAAGDLGWVLERHAVLYQREFGWGADFEASVAGIVAGLAADVGDPGQRGWIGEGPTGRLGSVFCSREDRATARLRLLLVEPAARGTGLGRTLVDRCVAFAGPAGYERIVLTTQDACIAARRIYGAAGFERVRSTRDGSYDPTGNAEDWTLTIRS